MIRFYDLFGGIGGFRLGLEGCNDKTTQENSLREASTGLLLRRDGDSADGSSGNARERVAPAEDKGSGFKCVGYCDNDKRSVGVYNYRFNENHKPTDARKLGEADLPEFDLLCAGFPCFSGDTLILTFEGYKPIKEIRIGDLVLTHKRKWHKVTGTMQRYADKTITLKGQGIHELTTTYEHPFLVRRKTERYGNRKYSAEWGQPEWVDAGKLDATTRVGETFPEQLDCSFTPDFWWIVGRYIADGWVVKRKDRKEGNGRVVISCGKHKFENTRKAIEKAFHTVAVEERTAYKFHITNSEFYKFVQQFGCGAGNKSIPGRYLGLEPVRARALLEGYLSGDGYWNRKQKCWGGTTISRKLAYSILLLNLAVNGTVGSLSKCKMPKTTIIEGRTVNQRDFYTVRLPSRNKSAFVDENSYGWKRLRSIEQNSGRLVYNISVEEDESYIAENAIVHNCQPFSLAGRRKGFDEERGTLFHEIARILEIRKPAFVLLENVKGLLSAQRGWCFAFILSRLSELGFDSIEWEIINSKNFGVPQNRERVFIFGSRTKGRPEIFPLGQGDCIPEAEDGGKRKGGKRIRSEVCSTIDARYGALRNAGETYLVDPYNATVKKGDIATTVRTNFSDGNSWIIDASSERKPRVYDKTCPTLNTMQGGQRQPIVLNQHYMRTGERGNGISEGQTTTLDSGCGRDIVVTPSLESGSLRRLTPRECEKLQGFPELESRISVQIHDDTLCLDLQKSFVDVESRNPKLQKLVGTVEKNKLKENAPFVEKSLNSIGYQQTNKLVQEVVRINCAESKVEILNQGKSLSLAPSATNQNGFRQPIKIEDFVLRVVGLNTIVKAIIRTGGVASHQNEMYFIRQEDGKLVVKLYGKEIMRFAEDVMKDSTILKKLFTSTTSNPSNTEDIDMKLITSFLFVLNAIIGYIPKETLNANILMLELHSNFGWTAFEKVGNEVKAVSDSARYKMLGNAVTVPVVTALGKKILEVESCERI